MAPELSEALTDVIRAEIAYKIDRGSQQAALECEEAMSAFLEALDATIDRRIAERVAR